MSHSFEGFDEVDLPRDPTIQGAIKNECLGNVQTIIDHIESIDHPEATLICAARLGTYANFAATVGLKYIDKTQNSDPQWHLTEVRLDTNNIDSVPNSPASLSIIHDPFPLGVAHFKPHCLRQFLRVPKNPGMITLGTTEYIPAEGVVSLTATIPYFSHDTRTTPGKLASALLELTRNERIRSEQDDGYGMPDISYPFPSSCLDLGTPLNAVEQKSHQRYRAHLLQLAKKVVLHTLESMPEQYYPESFDQS